MNLANLKPAARGAIMSAMKVPATGKMTLGDLMNAPKRTKKKALGKVSQLEKKASGGSDYGGGGGGSEAA